MSHQNLGQLNLSAQILLSVGGQLQSLVSLIIITLRL